KALHPRSQRHVQPHRRSHLRLRISPLLCSSASSFVFLSVTAVRNPSTSGSSEPSNDADTSTSRNWALTHRPVLPSAGVYEKMGRRQGSEKVRKDDDAMVRR